MLWVFLISAVQVALLGLLAVNPRSRRTWVRWAGIVFEVLMVLLRVQSLFAGEVLPALVGLVLAIVVIACLARGEARYRFSG